MRYFITRKFDKLLKNEKLPRGALEEVIRAIRSGNTVSLGRKLYKTRMRAAGRGKSGGYRTISYVKIGARIVFLVLFAKNERDNLTTNELAALKIYATELDNLIQSEIDALLSQGSLFELPFKP